MGQDLPERQDRRSECSERPLDGPPVLGYTWPEFLVEVLGILRRLSCLGKARLDPLEAIARWLSGPSGSQSRLEQWRASKRARRLILRLRAGLDLLISKYPEGGTVAYSASFDNRLEFVDFHASLGQIYEIRVSLYRNNSTWTYMALAWAMYSP